MLSNLSRAHVLLARRESVLLAARWCRCYHGHRHRYAWLGSYVCAKEMKRAAKERQPCQPIRLRVQCASQPDANETRGPDGVVSLGWGAGGGEGKISLCERVVPVAIHGTFARP